jgi:hypothetical protein
MIQEARDVANRLGLVPPFFDQTQYNMLHRERIEVEYGPLYPGEWLSRLLSACHSLERYPREV